jgi:hypothetical protein
VKVVSTRRELGSARRQWVRSAASPFALVVARSRPVVAVSYVPADLIPESVAMAGHHVLVRIHELTQGQEAEMPDLPPLLDDERRNATAAAVWKGLPGGYVMGSPS